LTHWVLEGEWVKALGVLGRQTDLDLYYRFAPVLFRHAPGPTVDALLRQPALDARQLVPALVQPSASLPDRQGAHRHAARFLRTYALDRQDADPAVHNALITVLAHGHDEPALLSFLAASVDDPETGLPRYDLDYALRLCRANGFVHACVQIYGKMGLYESSVDLALETGDIELAKLNADGPDDDDELRRKLWLRIAQHVVADKQDIKTCVCSLRRH